MLRRFFPMVLLASVAVACGVEDPGSYVYPDAGVNAYVDSGTTTNSNSQVTSTTCSAALCPGYCDEYGVCQVDPNQSPPLVGMYSVTLVSARVTRDGQVWCGFGITQCDAYATMVVAGTPYTSTIFSNSNTPYWNEVLIPSVSADQLAMGFAVSLWDHNDNAPDAPIGLCVPSEPGEPLIAGPLSMQCNNGGLDDPSTAVVQIQITRIQ